MQKISPKYKMKLLGALEKAIRDEYKTDDNVRLYIEKWHETYDNFNDDPNFYIHQDDATGIIRLKQTLHSLDDELSLKMAIDMGVETPDFIPAVAEYIENTLRVNYSAALETFKRALNQCRDHPDEAVIQANSVLESIVKHILVEDQRFSDPKKGDTLGKLMKAILSEFGMSPAGGHPKEINTIGSSIIALSACIESLRSNKTSAHGKLEEDYLIDHPMYAFFVINLVSSLGLFLISLYKNKLQPEYPSNDIPDGEIDLSDIPF